MQFSIRSLLSVTAGVAVLCMLYRAIPLESLVASSIIYFLAWIIPGISLGYDMKPSRNGLIIGGLIGLFAGAFLLILIPHSVPRE
ncbi:MAG: hypothetical protein COA78_02955 [Blastopirellula sp.]|nr:MAG: hypothetical protein COA78_02955 [Blastopirellula sp.]